MRNIILRSILLFTLATPPVATAGVPLPVEQFLEQNCQHCHNADVKKGGLDLAKLSTDLAKPGTISRWAQVADRVAAGEMPPKKRLDADAKKVFLSSLGNHLREADSKRIAAQGRVTARRLTRFEYERTIHDLLGIDLPLMNLLQEDPRADGFDTVSTAQQISHFQLEKYLNVADIALEEAFERAFRPLDSRRRELGFKELKKVAAQNREPLPRPKQMDIVSWANPRAFNGRMPATRVSENGWYRISLRVAAVNAPPDGQVWCSVQSGVCLAKAATLFWIGSFAATKEERDLHFEAWVESGHMLRVRPHDSGLKKNNLGKSYDSAQAEKAGLPGVAIKWIKMERITHGLDPAALQKLLFPGVKVEPGPGKVKLVSADPKADAARLVRTFASRAFRRPMTDAEVAPYVALAKKELDEGGSLLDALMGGYRCVLTSPRFLYLEEPAGRLPDHALAARLSYFLWSTMPDDELRTLADAGRLSEPKVLRTQVDRMLNHPRANGFIENFTGQWLNLTEIDATVPDGKLYPEYDEVLKSAMVEETRSFFRELVNRDLSVTNVVDSSFTFLNSRLARHYGVPWPGGEGFQRVALRPENRRGGIITHASVLKVTANGTTTSPVLRGVWMMERIMGLPVPPVPDNVPAIEPDIRGAKTIRDQLAKHRTAESCAMCHKKIDPPGFALENYDVIGGWRDNYRAATDASKPVKPGRVKEGLWRPGLAVDASYTTADGKSFKNLTDFKKILLSDPDQLARNVAAKLLTYGTGAGISFADRVTLDEIVAATRKQDHGMRALIHAVVSSKAFLNK
jgi:hypothetical protein